MPTAAETLRQGVMSALADLGAPLVGEPIPDQSRYTIGAEDCCW